MVPQANKNIIAKQKKDWHCGAVRYNVAWNTGAVCRAAWEGALTSDAAICGCAWEAEDSLQAWVIVIHSYGGPRWGS